MILGYFVGELHLMICGNDQPVRGGVEQGFEKWGDNKGKQIAQSANLNPQGWNRYWRYYPGEHVLRLGCQLLTSSMNDVTATLVF